MSAKYWLVRWLRAAFAGVALGAYLAGEDPTAALVAAVFLGWATDFADHVRGGALEGDTK